MIILSLVVSGSFPPQAGCRSVPQIDLPTITVTVISEGASPQEIE
jgi:multidrug efflux pump subunit AcrB